MPDGHDSPCRYSIDLHESMNKHMEANQAFETRIWEGMQSMESRLREAFERVRDRLPNWAVFLISALCSVTAVLATLLAVSWAGK